MSEAEYSTSAVYRDRDTGKFRVKGSSHISAADEDSGSASFADIAAKFDAANELMEDLGINPAASEVAGLATQAPFYNTSVYLEPETGKVRVKGAANNPDTETGGSATFDTLEASINAMIAQLDAAGINPGLSEDLAAQHATYNGDVYMEQETGKVRVKSATHIAMLESSDEAADVLAEKMNDILDLLTALGANPDA